LKLEEGRFRLGVRKTFFYNESGGTLAQVAPRGGRSPSLETFKVGLDWLLSNLIWW